MTTQDLIDLLLSKIEQADQQKSDAVTIKKYEAVELLSLLLSTMETGLPRTGEDGQMLFYCADCSQSFRAEPREDPECFARWQYRRWYADCPRCRREVSQNDRYWR